MDIATTSSLLVPAELPQTIQIINQIPKPNESNSWVFLLVGAGITLVVGIITNLLTQWFTHHLMRQRSREDFKLKLLELKIGAAQQANQYVYRIYREYTIDSSSEKLIKLGKETRDWLDGQAILLGDDAYRAVFGFINIVFASGSTKSLIAEAMNLALSELRIVCETNDE